MSSSVETAVRAASARCTRDALVVQLSDGRVLYMPLLWFPRLDAATAAQRADLRLIGDGEGIHWPGVDEDLEVASLLLSEAEIRRGYRAPAQRQTSSRLPSDMEIRRAGRKPDPRQTSSRGLAGGAHGRR